LGLFFFPFDFINLQVQKPAYADLLTSQFTRELGEIHPDFSSRPFATGARVFHPTGAHRARMRLLNNFSLCACAFWLNLNSAHALCAPVYEPVGAHLILISHCKVLGCGESHFPS
jgi:hypothetical protein